MAGPTETPTARAMQRPATNSVSGRRGGAGRGGAEGICAGSGIQPDGRFRPDRPVLGEPLARPEDHHE